MESRPCPYCHNVVVPVRRARGLVCPQCDNTGNAPRMVAPSRRTKGLDRPAPVDPRATRAMVTGITAWVIFAVVAVLAVVFSDVTALRYAMVFAVGFGISAWTEGRKAANTTGATAPNVARAKTGRALGMAAVLTIPVLVITAAAFDIASRQGDAGADDSPIAASKQVPTPDLAFQTDEAKDRIQVVAGDASPWDAFALRSDTPVCFAVGPSATHTDACTSGTAQATAFRASGQVTAGQIVALCGADGPATAVTVMMQHSPSGEVVYQHTFDTVAACV